MSVTEHAINTVRYLQASYWTLVTAGVKRTRCQLGCYTAAHDPISPLAIGRDCGIRTE
jgi:hypothetical protein